MITLEVGTGKTYSTLTSALTTGISSPLTDDYEILIDSDVYTDRPSTPSINQGPYSVTIKAVEPNEGKYDETKGVWIKGGYSSGYVFTMNEAGYHLQGIGIYNTSIGGAATLEINGNENTFNGCYFKSSSNTGTKYALQLKHVNGNGLIGECGNSIVDNSGGQGSGLGFDRRVYCNLDRVTIVDAGGATNAFCYKVMNTSNGTSLSAKIHSGIWCKPNVGGIAFQADNYGVTTDKIASTDTTASSMTGATNAFNSRTSTDLVDYAEGDYNQVGQIGGYDIGAVLAVGGDTPTVHNLAFQDIGVDIRTDQLAVTRTTNLQIHDIVIQSAIDSINISKTSNLGFTDLAIQPSMDSLYVVRVRDLALQGLAIQPALDIAGSISINTVSKNLEFQDITSQIVLDTITLSKSVNLNFNGIIVQPKIDIISLGKITSLEFQDIAVDTVLDNLTIVDKVLPVITGSNVKLYSATIKFSSDTNTPKYRTSIE